MEGGKFKAKDIPSLFMTAFKKMVQDYGFMAAGALAYFGTLAMPAVLVIVIWVAGLIVGEGEVQQQIMSKLGTVLGDQAGEQLQGSLSSTGAGGDNLIMKVVGIITLVLSASVAIVYLQKALNRVWGVKKDPEAGIKATVFQRLLSIAVILGLGLLLLAFIVTTSFISGFINTITAGLPSYVNWVVYGINFLMSFGFIWLIFALIFKIVPDAEIRFHSVWVGAAVTAFLFVVGQHLISFYLANASPGEAYGAAGSLVVIMVWLFYSALIFLLGAEFTQAYAERYGHRIKPAKFAINADEDCGDQERRFMNSQEGRNAA